MRKPGFYRVKDHVRWLVAEYIDDELFGLCWSLPGEEWNWEDAIFVEIDERRIPMPDDDDAS
jgi:hypothetical protein